MKKFFATLFVGFMAAMTCQAQETQNFDGIDHVNIVQSINLDTCKVYIVPTVLAEKKGSKKAEEQDVAFAELGKTLARELKATYPKGSFEVIKSAKEAPSGAVVIEACMKEIEWGSGVKRQISFGVNGKIAASYSAKISNGNGLVLEFDTRRSHNTALVSALGPDVIRIYNRVLASDLISILARDNRKYLKGYVNIDYVAVMQKVDLNNSKVYIVPTVFADPKPNKDEKGQQKGFAELGETLKKALETEFKTATFVLINDINEAPADAVVIQAFLKDIDWGAATSADVMGGGQSLPTGGYQAIVSNAKGKILEFKNRRSHNVTMSSSKPTNLIKVFNKAFAKDLVDLLKTN